MRLDELARRLAVELVGDGALEVRRVVGIETAGPGDLSFVGHPRYAAQAATSRATALIVPAGLETPAARLVCANPYLVYARALALLHPQLAPPPGVHPSAQVDPGAELGPGVHVGPLAVVGAGARVGARSVLHAQVVLYPGAVVGEDCRLHAAVQVREGCRLGDRVVVQNGAVIGADGFGFARDEHGRYHKIPQVGVVVIEDDVEIGALTAIDRSATAETRIGRGTKLDNLVQIGHSVQVGQDTVMAAQVGVAGSARIGSGVMLGGQVGIAGHISLGDGVVAIGQTGVTGSIEAGRQIAGTPAVDARTWRRNAALAPRLPELVRRVRELERRLARLEEKG